MSDNRLKIGITQGDTNGIGWGGDPQNARRQPHRGAVHARGLRLARSGGYYRRCIADLEEIAFNTVSSARDARRGRVNLIACGPQELRIVPGEPSPEAGRAAVEALQTAVRDLKRGYARRAGHRPDRQGDGAGRRLPLHGAHRVPRRRTGRLAHDADVQRSAACGARDDAPAAGGGERRDLAGKSPRPSTGSPARWSPISAW